METQKVRGITAADIKRFFRNRKNERHFNSLPSEILIKIFCQIDCNQLYELKSMCRKWYRLIHDIAGLKRLDISKEKMTDAMYVFRKWSNSNEYGEHSSSFNIYQTPYVVPNVICPATMRTLIEEYSGIFKFDYSEFIENLEYVAKTVVMSKGKVEPYIWKCLLSITGLSEQYSVNNLVKKAKIYSKLPAMEDYEWHSNGYDQGITVLYPDKRTFAVFICPSIDIEDRKGSEDDRPGNGYDEWLGNYEDRGGSYYNSTPWWASEDESYDY